MDPLSLSKVCGGPSLSVKGVWWTLFRCNRSMVDPLSISVKGVWWTIPLCKSNVMDLDPLSLLMECDELSLSVLDSSYLFKGRGGHPLRLRSVIHYLTVKGVLQTLPHCEGSVMDLSLSKEYGEPFLSVKWWTSEGC